MHVYIIGLPGFAGGGGGAKAPSAPPLATPMVPAFTVKHEPPGRPSQAELQMPTRLVSAPSQMSQMLQSQLNSTSVGGPGSQHQQQSQQQQQQQVQSLGGPLGGGPPMLPQASTPQPQQQAPPPQHPPRAQSVPTTLGGSQPPTPLGGGGGTTPVSSTGNVVRDGSVRLRFSLGAVCRLCSPRTAFYD